MRQLPDWPLTGLSESPTLQWDFSQELAPEGLTISSVTTSCVVSFGTDNAAASRLQGSPQIVSALAAPYGSGLAKAMVTQAFTGGLAGVRYRIAAIATLNNGDVIEYWFIVPMGWQ